MSILINMEMPEGCQHCHFSYEYDVQDDVAYGCWLTMKTRPIECYNRPDYCPLIEVPEHGDLIDREPFIEFIEKNWDSYDQWFIGQLEARPIVIPADKDGET